MADPEERTPLLPNSSAHGQPPPPTPRVLRNPDSWDDPVSLPPRNESDETLQIFRRAVGINSSLTSTQEPSSLEAGRRSAEGIYLAVVNEQQSKKRQHLAILILHYSASVAQILIGAALTALGAVSSEHPVVITVLGAINTVLAGLLALINRQGLRERLHKDEIEFRRLQDWIEQTETLIAQGVIGRDRHEVGLLVERAFKKYNAAAASEENNRPGSYVIQQEEAPEPQNERQIVEVERSASCGSDANGNAIVKLNIR